MDWGHGRHQRWPETSHVAQAEASLAPKLVPTAFPLAAASANAIPSLQIHLAKSQSPDYDRHRRALTGQSLSPRSGSRLQTLPAVLCASAPAARAGAGLLAWGSRGRVPPLADGSSGTSARAGWGLRRRGSWRLWSPWNSCSWCWAAEADVPERQGSAVKGIAAGAAFERRGKASALSAPYLPPYLAYFRLSTDPNVIWFKFLRFRLWPP